MRVLKKNYFPNAFINSFPYIKINSHVDLCKCLLKWQIYQWQCRTKGQWMQRRIKGWKRLSLSQNDCYWWHYNTIPIAQSIYNNFLPFYYSKIMYILIRRHADASRSYTYIRCVHKWIKVIFCTFHSHACHGVLLFTSSKSSFYTFLSIVVGEYNNKKYI